MEKNNKLLSVYFAWITLHFILWFSGGAWGWYTNYFGEVGRLYWDLKHIYPFHHKNGSWLFDPTEVYDLSELVFYMIIPLLLFLVVRFWNKKDNTKFKV